MAAPAISLTRTLIEESVDLAARLQAELRR